MHGGAPRVFVERPKGAEHGDKLGQWTGQPVIHCKGAFSDTCRRRQQVIVPEECSPTAAGCSKVPNHPPDGSDALLETAMLQAAACISSNSCTQQAGKGVSHRRYIM